MYTMGDVAKRTQLDEEWFYQTFGIDAEILIDHAWGIEPVTMADIKNYKTDARSISSSQVLPRPYRYPEARIVFAEMADDICSDLLRQNLVTRGLSWWTSYDYKSLESNPHYSGPLTADFYGRLHPRHSNGTVRLKEMTNSRQIISAALIGQFDAKCDHNLLFRRLGISANDVRPDKGLGQLELFTDYDALEKERRIQGAMLEIRKRYGKNAVIKGTNLLEGATAIERNTQIGGHKA